MVCQKYINSLATSFRLLWARSGVVYDTGRERRIQLTELLHSGLANCRANGFPGTIHTVSLLCLNHVCRGEKEAQYLQSERLRTHFKSTSQPIFRNHPFYSGRAQLRHPSESRFQTRPSPTSRCFSRSWSRVVNITLCAVRRCSRAGHSGL